MASYTAEQLNGAGTPTEVLSGAKTFTLTNPATGSAYFTVETVRNGNGNYGDTVVISGNNITAQTATSMTDSTVNFNTLGVKIGDLVTDTVNGDTATVTAITSNTELAISANIFSVALETYSIINIRPSNALGVYGSFTNIDSDTLVTSSYISSVVVPEGNSSYQFTPTTTVAISSSMLRATGGITLTIS
tara:strand:- start:116 stop:685 length:570 start_codon:yes stop_codon:yes gene_type:complete